LQQVRAVKSACELPIIGMGGVSSGADAAEFIAAGATLVAVGTENFRDPQAGLRITKELETKLSGGTLPIQVLDLQ
jgi:dihydroorotate dehydrogenase (NAD+) catalytic subunit